MGSILGLLYPRRSPWRLLVLLAIANLLVGEALWAFRPRMKRVIDEAGLLDPREIPQFNGFLGAMYDESGVDIRFLFVRGVPDGDLETYALEGGRRRDGPRCRRNGRCEVCT